MQGHNTMQQDYLSDGAKALIAIFIKEQTEEAAVKMLNEVSRQNILSSNELKNIAIDEIRKELWNLATKDEVKFIRDELVEIKEQMKNFATKDELKIIKDEMKSIKDELTEVKEQMKNFATKDFVDSKITQLKAELKQDIAEVRAEMAHTKVDLTRWIVGTQVAAVSVIIALIKFIL